MLQIPPVICFRCTILELCFSCGRFGTDTVRLGGSHLEAQRYLLTARTLGDLQV